jgi:hypothetical protein
VSNNVVLLWHLEDKGRVKTKSGGAFIVEPLLYGENTTSASYSGYDPLSLTPQEGISAAQFDWKQHNVSIAISGEEEKKNNGAEAILDLLEAKVKQAEITAANDFNVMFHSSATPGNSGKDFTGIGVLIGDEASSVTTVGGINCTTAGNEFWRSYVSRSVEALSIEDVGRAFIRASKGTEKPDFGLTTSDLWLSFEAQLQPHQRMTDPKMANVGFTNIAYHGARVTYDDDVAAGDFTWLNTNYVYLVKHSQAWLTHTPFDRPSGIDATYAHILSMGQLVVVNRQLGGSRLEDSTAS